jgi:hypothetical protein
MKSGLKKNNDAIEEVVLRKKDNVVYVDFALYSMVKSVEDWYIKNYRDDKYGTNRKAHMFHTIRFYDRNRFKNHDTIGTERDKYLEEVDLYVQMKRED